MSPAEKDISRSTSALGVVPAFRSTLLGELKSSHKYLCIEGVYTMHTLEASQYTHLGISRFINNDLVTFLSSE